MIAQAIGVSILGRLMAEPPTDASGKEQSLLRRREERVRKQLANGGGGNAEDDDTADDAPRDGALNGALEKEKELGAAMSQLRSHFDASYFDGGSHTKEDGTSLGTARASVPVGSEMAAERDAFADELSSFFVDEVTAEEDQEMQRGGAKLTDLADSK